MDWLFGVVFGLIVLLGMEMRLIDVTKSIKELKDFTQKSRDRIAVLEKELTKSKKSIYSEKLKDEV